MCNKPLKYEFYFSNDYNKMFFSTTSEPTEFRNTFTCVMLEPVLTWSIDSKLLSTDPIKPLNGKPLV